MYQGLWGLFIYFFRRRVLWLSRKNALFTESDALQVARIHPHYVKLFIMINMKTRPQKCTQDWCVRISTTMSLSSPSLAVDWPSSRKHIALYSILYSFDRWRYKISGKMMSDGCRRVSANDESPHFFASWLNNAFGNGRSPSPTNYSCFYTFLSVLLRLNHQT